MKRFSLNIPDLEDVNEIDMLVCELLEKLLNSKPLGQSFRDYLGAVRLSVIQGKRPLDEKGSIRKLSVIIDFPENFDHDPAREEEAGCIRNEVRISTAISTSSFCLSVAARLAQLLMIASFAQGNTSRFRLGYGANALDSFSFYWLTPLPQDTPKHFGI